MCIRDRKVTLTQEEASLTARGMPIEDRFTGESSAADLADADMTACNEIAAVDEQGKLLAILVPRKGGLGPVRNFVSS